ncbi:hypothetical protein BXY39_1840 [Eilatimonas milleporae]|uniref:Uncharacterized protein n=1 Tax=Eilatimonas milleporae TaxID=911205 RepID=A0A3M0CD43_9PROT|nr:hypothetical protein BXY39_1840 [Eilatimonas milleporae]
MIREVSGIRNFLEVVPSPRRYQDSKTRFTMSRFTML